MVASPIMLLPRELETKNQDELDETVKLWLQQGRAGYCDLDLSAMTPPPPAAATEKENKADSNAD